MKHILLLPALAFSAYTTAVAQKEKRVVPPPPPAPKQSVYEKIFDAAEPKGLGN